MTSSVFTQEPSAPHDDAPPSLQEVAIDAAQWDPAGFWPVERDHVGAFRWSRKRFTLNAPAEGILPFVELICAASVPVNLNITSTGSREQRRLADGWQTISIRTAGSAPVELEIGHTFVPGGGDERELGLMVRSIAFHDDVDRHQTIDNRHQNLMLNLEELQSGTTLLQSVPPRLRVTCSKQCNIANEEACVYCAWKVTKEAERGSPEQDLAFYRDMGRFFDLPIHVNDCSYGEPPMERDFAGIVDEMTRHGRCFEFTSNGQTLGPRKRAAMLGKNVRLHVSNDSATAAGYQRYRDRRFDLIIDNLRALCAERKAHNMLPEISVSFIVMRSNRDEVFDYLDLMHDVGVDQVSFRALYLDEPQDFLVTDHNGFNFDYEAEVLTPAEHNELAKSCRTYGADLGPRVIIEWEDFAEGVAATAPGAPICSEPWATIYLLARGIMPCCYGRRPIAKWSDMDLSGGVEAAVSNVVNSPEYVELRTHLARCELAPYCHECASCPLVKQHNVAN